MSLEDRFDTVLLKRSEGVATLTLNRPERLNSFTAAMHADLRAALELVRGDRSLRALILTGAGRGFCAGQDLGERTRAIADGTLDLSASVDTNYKPLVLALRSLDMPVLAAVNGIAAGAGSSLALACDVVFATRSASFIQSFGKLGLIPDTGGSWMLPRAVGHARAMGLALFAEPLTAEQAAEWGLIWRCVDDEALMPTVVDAARKLASGPTRGYIRTRQALLASTANELETQLDLERDFMGELGNSRDYREGVAAFVAKRAPHFTGE